jgi:hypothetical protein
MPGSRPGERRGGRQPGTKNKSTVEREQARARAAARITAVLGADAFEGDAHDLLVAVYKDSSQPIGLRVDAAKAAIGYEKPRHAVVSGNADGGTSSIVSILEEIAAERHAQRLTQSGKVIEAPVVVKLA